MSSSDVEILPISRSASFLRASASATNFQLDDDLVVDEESYSYRSNSRDASAAPSASRTALKQTESQVIELSDGSDDDEMQVLGQVGRPEAFRTDKSAPAPSSDDLPPPFFNRRSESLGPIAAPSRYLPTLPQPRPPPAPAAAPARRVPSKTLAQLDESDLLEEPRLDTATSKAKGKARAALLPEWDGSGSEDEYDKMARRGPQVVRKKRPHASKTSAALLGGHSLLEEDDSLPPPKKKGTTKAADPDKAAKKQEQLAAKQAKEDAKADKAARIKANNLKTKDKHSTVAELTVHISGTAFRGPDSASDTDSDSEALYESAADRKRRKKAKQKKASAWVEVARLLKERLAEHGCDVEAPELPRKDIGCEGAMRWMRECNKKWDDDRREFIPLGEGNEIIVEEDSRLVFMTALELSKHIANRTLGRHIASILASIPPHVHLFLMHFGLKTLCREMTNAEQAAYREQARANLAGADAAAGPAPKARAVGIGPKQPDKETLEYELMKAQTINGFKTIAVDTVEEAVDWLEQICYDVSQKPYQRHKMMHIVTLGTGDEKIVSGKTLEDTYTLMLASLKGITEAAAKGVVREYPTVRELYEGWAACRSEREKKEMLADVMKGHLTTGARTDRTIGKAASEFIYKVFNHRDPNLFL